MARTRCRIRGIGLFAMAIVAIAGLVGGACATSERAVIGTCPIRPGALCAGNYMKGSRLQYSVLFDANLDHADLDGAELQWSNLAGATMREAKLAHANLAGAQLAYADVGGADLRGANLRGAVLAFTNFNGAKLAGASLTGAFFCRTIMPDGTIASPDC